MAKARHYAERVNVIKMVKVNGRRPFSPVVERNGEIVRDHFHPPSHVSIEG